jgi:hypothetical protein
MADVFRAHDELLDRDVAVKVFRAVANDDCAVQGKTRCRLELQSLAQLSHPNLITLYDGEITEDGAGYLVLELVPGKDLATRLRSGPLPEPEVRRIGAQIADALAYVHARGMVHRDVKPGNILLGTDGPEQSRARLSDFGTVRLVDGERMTSVALTLGTASYIAPEQVLGADVEPAADVYSLGLVLMEALTGERCFDGGVEETLAARLVTSPPVPESLPAPWPALLGAMLARDPAQRPGAADVAASLGARAAPRIAAAPRPGDETTVVPVRRARHGAVGSAARSARRESGVRFAVAGLAFAALLAAAGYFMVGAPASNRDAGTTVVPSAPPRHVATAARRPTSAAVEVRAGQGARPVRPTRSSARAAGTQQQPAEAAAVVARSTSAPAPTSSAAVPVVTSASALPTSPPPATSSIAAPSTSTAAPSSSPPASGP